MLCSHGHKIKGQPLTWLLHYIMMMIKNILGLHSLFKKYWTMKMTVRHKIKCFLWTHKAGKEHSCHRKRTIFKHLQYKTCSAPTKTRKCFKQTQEQRLHIIKNKTDPEGVSVGKLTTYDVEHGQRSTQGCRYSVLFLTV